MKRLLMIAAAVVVLGVGAVALGGAVTTAQEGDGPFGSILAKVADKLGVSEEELQTAFDEARDETIDEAVADGSLTEEQAERLKERAEEGGLLFGGRGPNGRGHHVIDAALQVLDMEKDELRQQFSEGNSLAEIAEAQGMNAEEFEAEVAGLIQADIEEKAASGDITEEQAERILADLEEHVDRVVNRDPDDGPPHRHGGFGGASSGETSESEDITA
jgi:membrane-bound lytic murein transglycosylase B